MSAARSAARSDLAWVSAARAQLRPVGETPAELTTERARSLGFELALEPGVVIRAAELYLGTDVRIGRGTRIEADRVYLGDMVTIGSEATLVTGELVVADGATLGDRVAVDLAGGKHEDSSLQVGPASVIGSWVHVNTCRAVRLDARSALSPGCMVFTHSYWQSVLDGYGARFQPVDIEADAWVGAGCQVLPGVRVGRGSIVMGNSTVIANVAAETLVGGVPARVLREALRRPLAPAAARAAVARIVGGLVERLRGRGAAVASLPDDGFTLELADGSTHAIGFAAPGRPAPRAGEVVLALEPWERGPGAGSVFDFAGRRFSGVETPVAFEVRNALRRHGIRFEPAAWRADPRRGV